MKINIKKLHEDAVIPQYSKQGDAGLDLTAVSRRTDPKGFTEYDTAIAVSIPTGYVGLVFPRSSISKVNMQLCNAVGVIDSSYRGSIKLRFKPSTSGINIYNIGDRVGQLVIIPYPQIEFNEVSELDETERGEGGFGSSDIKEELDQERIFISESGHVEKFTLREELNGKENT